MEFVGTLPILLLAALVCLQAFLLAMTALYAQVAADRAARGASRSSIVQSLPAAWRPGAQVRASGDQVRIRVGSPVVLPLPADARELLAVTARSEVTT